jgi:hypothetical protein
VCQASPQAVCPFLRAMATKPLASLANVSIMAPAVCPYMGSLPPHRLKTTLASVAKGTFQQCAAAPISAIPAPEPAKVRMPLSPSPHAVVGASPSQQAARVAVLVWPLAASAAFGNKTPHDRRRCLAPCASADFDARSFASTVVC